MSKSIRPDEFAGAISEIIGDFGENVRNAAKEAVKQSASESARELKGKGDFGGTGAYKKSWKYQIQNGRMYSTATVYNAKYYRLTHLLEFGHALAGGGRSRSFEHIAPVNNEVPEKFEKAFEEALK